MNTVSKSLISYGDNRRKWSGDFQDYMKSIVLHPNYKGMPSAIDEEGRIRWNAPSNRPPGKWQDLRDRRLEWWRNKADSLKIPTVRDWISKVAKVIHPFKEKPCQTCGKIMSLRYVYPTKNTLKKINSFLEVDDQIKQSDFLTIFEIIPILIDKTDHQGFEILNKIFPELKDTQPTIEEYSRKFENEIVPSEPKGKLSPGCMSNAPDRLDGFHTYNLCCRGNQDTGRLVENLKTYSDDRRAFEFWSGGDWSAANILMTMSGFGKCPGCNKDKALTADHIGPLSLGFSHRPKFKPLCKSCNSSKGNRFNLADVVCLINDEKDAQEVASWQIQTLWDNLKNKIKTDDDALKLSKLLRINQHYYLMLLSTVHDLGYSELLLNYLHPEFAEFTIEYKGINKADFTFSAIERKKRADGYSISKASRMIRISFESLDYYKSKAKRNIHFIPTELEKSYMEKIVNSLHKTYLDDKFRQLFNSTLKENINPEEKSIKLEKLLNGNYLPRNDYSESLVVIKEYVDLIGQYLTNQF